MCAYVEVRAQPWVSIPLPSSLRQCLSYVYWCVFYWMAHELVGTLLSLLDGPWVRDDSPVSPGWMAHELVGTLLCLLDGSWTCGVSPASAFHLAVGLCTTAGFMSVLGMQGQVLRLAWQTLYPLSSPGPNLAFRSPYTGNRSESQNTFPPLGGKRKWYLSQEECQPSWQHQVTSQGWEMMCEGSRSANAKTLAGGSKCWSFAMSVPTFS